MFPVFLDTCVLLKPYLCDTLLSIAECQTYRPLWSKHVLDELDRNLRKRGATAEQAAHRIDQMSRHFPDAQVVGYEHLIDSMENHPKDRHVLAAAVRGGAEVLVTENLKDFPAAALKRYDIVAVHQDDFLQDQFELFPSAVNSALRRQVSRYRRSPRSVEDLLDVLSTEGHGCAGFAEACRRELSPWKD
ncbi:Predicted nucleic acid-binding protein, contains PIN domain [Lentzea fradiae]|uniref:Predicted nucleic acid-binding protein, contains PIN domain n=1 Tax=Lentzea fradiae TaxID=200378 RepID=A0A1G7M4K1_9PSEU|nr:PIN domain-containing protein [Lentzea fradiae]SDF56718.1 Predicted nucleic acid-binding protein, contains PIN domain [Lentzea fradiae]